MLSTYVHMYYMLVVINFLIFLNPLCDILFLFLSVFLPHFTAHSGTKSEIKSVILGSHTLLKSTFLEMFSNEVAQKGPAELRNFFKKG